MTNHPNRKRSPYIAMVGGNGFGQVRTAEFATMREARAWAAEYNATADYCTITDASGRVVGNHRRDTNTGRWFRAAI